MLILIFQPISHFGSDLSIAKIYHCFQFLQCAIILLDGRRYVVVLQQCGVERFHTIHVSLIDF